MQLTCGRETCCGGRQNWAGDCDTGAGGATHAPVPPRARERKSLHTSRRPGTHLAAFSSLAIRPGIPPSSALRCTHLNVGKRQGTSPPGHLQLPAVPCFRSARALTRPMNPAPTPVRPWRLPLAQCRHQVQVRAVQIPAVPVPAPSSRAAILALGKSPLISRHPGASSHSRTAAS
jgi:hypothetical protein